MYITKIIILYLDFFVKKRKNAIKAMPFTAESQ